MSTSAVSIDDPRAPLRRTIYGLLIGLSAAVSVARIYTVESTSHRTPFLSANDRSRWSTVRSLVDFGTYAIDDVIFRPNGKRDSDWASIDIVRHRGRDGHEHFYSSKPPLFATLLAGEYWVVKAITGASLGEQPFYVGRIMLVLTNVLPFSIALLLLARLIEKMGTSDWGRVITIAAAAWGTYLTTMNVTLNNHSIAAVSVIVATYFAVGIWQAAERPKTWWFALAGFFAAFAAANELPALSFVACIAAALGLKSWRQTLMAFAPAAIVVAGAALFTNYLAHDSWRPPYAHRNKDGRVISVVPLDAGRELAEANVPKIVKEKMAAAGIELSNEAKISPRARDERWVLWEPTSERRFAIARHGDVYEIRQWDDWYEFDGSYWSSGKQNGVDKGEPSRATYAFHALLGHHGVFSLTPIWLLSVVGIGIWLAKRDRLLTGFALMVVALSVVCTTFYIFRPLIDRNYGGVSCGFRWLFWLIPLWLVCMLPACDWLSRSRFGRWLAMGFLGVSVFSAAYSGNNPWSHPWLFHYWTTLGWIEY